MNFRYRLMQFLSGRYGVDKLFYGIMGLAAAIAFLNLFIRQYFVQIVVYALLFYALFRILSRNHEARIKENKWFIGKISFLKNKKDFYYRKKSDSLHVYKKCPTCKAVLRLPHRVGVHKTVCPRCGREFTVKVKK